MKKFLKGAAILTAMVLALACFAGCKNDDDEGSTGADFTNMTDVKSLNDLVGTWSVTLKKDRDTYEFIIGGTTYKVNEKRKVIGEVQFIIKGTSDEVLKLDYKVLEGVVMITELTITEPETIADDVVTEITEELEEIGEVTRVGNKFTVTETIPQGITSSAIKMDGDKCFVYDDEDDEKRFLIKLNDAKNGIEFYLVEDDEVAEEPEYRATKK